MVKYQPAALYAICFSLVLSQLLVPCQAQVGDIVIPVPDDPKKAFCNAVIRTIGLIIYSTFLCWVLYHIAVYLILKKRYKDYHVLLYYVLFVSLFTVRIIQLALQFENLNTPTIRNTIVAADGLSVCIGLSQMGLILNLVFVLQCFRGQALEDERATIADLNNRLAKLEKRQELKSRASNIIISLLILATVLEVCLRAALNFHHPLIIVNSELLLIGICLLIETLIFRRLSKEVFGDEFQDEQRFFMVSMIVFLTTYTCRFAFLMAIMFKKDLYLRWFEGSPVLAGMGQMTFHILYDSFPVLHIMLRHNQTLGKEEKQTTMVVMTPSREASTVGTIEDDHWRLTI